MFTHPDAHAGMTGVTASATSVISQVEPTPQLRWITRVAAALEPDPFWVATGPVEPTYSMVLQQAWRITEYRETERFIRTEWRDVPTATE